MKAFTLYRHYGEHNQLLYVGQSAKPLDRLSSHMRDSSWRHAIRQVSMKYFPDRASMLEAEKEAIRQERPIHNKMIPRPVKPSKVARLQIWAGCGYSQAMEKLKLWMADKGMNNRDFARCADLTDSIVSRILNGQTKQPDPDTIIKIRDATEGQIGLDDWRTTDPAEGNARKTA